MKDDKLVTELISPLALPIFLLILIPVSLWTTYWYVDIFNWVFDGVFKWRTFSKLDVFILMIFYNGMRGGIKKNKNTESYAVLTLMLAPIYWLLIKFGMWYYV